MGTFKSLLVLGAVFTASAHVQAATTYLYALSFVEDRTWAAATIVYTGTQLPSSSYVLNLDHTGGDVNGCAPPLIQATVQSDTEVLFSPSGGISPTCTGTTAEINGFAFYVENALNIGAYSTTGAGRLVNDGQGGYDTYFAGGSLTIREGVNASPVPEPSTIFAGITLLVVPFTRKLIVR